MILKDETFYALPMRRIGTDFGGSTLANFVDFLQTVAISLAILFTLFALISLAFSTHKAKDKGGVEKAQTDHFAKIKIYIIVAIVCAFFWGILNMLNNTASSGGSRIGLPPVVLSVS